MPATYPYYRGPKSRRAGYIRGRKAYWKRQMGTGRPLVRGRNRGYLRKTGFYNRYGPKSMTGSPIEHKHLDTAISDVVVSSNMTAQQITTVGQGNEPSERIGRKITVKKILLRLVISIPTTVLVGNTSDVIKLGILMDTQTNGAVFTVTDYLVADNIHSYRSLANSGRFKILWTKTYNISTSAGAGTTAPAVVFATKNFMISKGMNCNIPIEYSQVVTDGTITSLRSNSLYLIQQSQSGLLSMVGTVRIRYSDQ